MPEDVRGALDADRSNNSRARLLLASASGTEGRTLKGEQVLHYAVWGGDRRTVAALIKAGAEINAADRLGITPLMLAAREGKAQVVEALLGAGADAMRRNRMGEDAVSLASQRGHSEVVKMLTAARVGQ